jgi:putative acetyltransferase
MSGVANPKLALRPYLPADAAMLAIILRTSVEELTGDDYNEEQQEAWAATVDDEADFAARLAERLTLIATLGGAPIGFVALEGNDKIDLLYVHPAAVGQGVAAMLCDAIEKLAAARGAAKLKVEASDTAESFFHHRGYVPQQRNTVLREGVWLANTTMEKLLSGKSE